MALRQEIELKRIREDIHWKGSMSKPLTSLDANTHDDLHVKPQCLYSAENTLLSHLNKRHVDDHLVKATLMQKPVWNDVREETNEFRIAENVAQQSRKSFPTATLYKKASYGEKENLESCSVSVRGGFSSPKPKISAGMPGFTDVKGFQEGFGVLNKPLPRLELNIIDENNQAVGGPNISIRDGKLLSECKTIARQDSDGPPTTILGKSKGFYSQNRQLDPRLEDTLCFVLDSSTQTPTAESRERAQPLTVLVHEKMNQTSCDLCSCSIQTMRVPLLGQCQDQSEQESFHGLGTQGPQLANSLLLRHLESPSKQGKNTKVCAEDPGHVWRQDIKTPLVGQSKVQDLQENSCSLPRPEVLKSSVLSQLQFQSMQNVQTCEEVSTINNDHVVVLFSVQNTLKGGAARISRQELLKLSRVCLHYSRKVLSWITSLCRKQTIKGKLWRIQQIFSSAPRGFVDLNSQKLPELSTRLSSLSSKRKLAKDDELKVVLMKINEVLASMDRTSPDDRLDSMQENDGRFQMK